MRAFSLAAIALCAGAAVAVMPALGAAPGAKPTPTPTPVALQYDEINKVVMSPATPPPPGNWPDDYKLAMSAVPSNNAGESTEAATPAPHRGGLGGMLGGMMGGNPGGGPPGMGGGNPMAMMNAMKTGTLTRYTFYYTKNWVREDNPVAQTATISKCPQHQFIVLDLAHKTYKITDTSPKGCDTTPMMGGMGGGRAQVNEAPGTADVTLKNTAQNLGPKTIDGINTTGSSDDFEMSMTNATGSCKDADMSMQRVVYISGIHKPRAFCPLTTHRMGPSSPTEAAAQGGCKPTIHGSMAGNPMAGSNSDLLEMYLLTTMGGGADMHGHSFGSLTLRGNVGWLYKEQADPLFAVPPGFTEQT